MILDVDTGEVLALASLPAFNPNKVGPRDKWVPDDLAKQGETASFFKNVSMAGAALFLFALVANGGDFGPVVSDDLLSLCAK